MNIITCYQEDDEVLWSNLPHLEIYPLSLFLASSNSTISVCNFFHTSLNLQIYIHIYKPERENTLIRQSTQKDEAEEEVQKPWLKKVKLRGRDMNCNIYTCVLSNFLPFTFAMGGDVIEEGLIFFFGPRPFVHDGDLFAIFLLLHLRLCLVFSSQRDSLFFTFAIN